MNRNSLQSSLMISTSLSLLLIGIFIYIDKDKIETKFFPPTVEKFIKETPDDSLCSNLNYWKTNRTLSSEELNNFFLIDNLFLSPELYNHLKTFSICLRDRTLKIETPQITIINSKTASIEKLINKANFTLASLSTLHNSSNEIIISQKILLENP